MYTKSNYIVFSALFDKIKSVALLQPLKLIFSKWPFVEGQFKFTCWINISAMTTVKGSTLILIMPNQRQPLNDYFYYFNLLISFFKAAGLP